MDKTLLLYIVLLNKFDILILEFIYIQKNEITIELKIEH